MNRILLRALTAAVLFWIGLQLYSPGDSQTFDRLLYVVIIVTNLAVLIHMFWDRKLHLWGTGSIAILLGAAGWATLFGWFLSRSSRRLDPGISEGWLDVVRVLIAISGPLLIYAMIRFRLDKLNRDEPARPGELLTEGLPDRRQEVRREEDRAIRAENEALRSRLSETMKNT